MQEDSRSLDEVVVVGYGTQKKVNLTGAVSVVEGDQLAGRSASTMSQLLQGAVPNMTVSFSSGRAGDGGSFNIRGVNSISGSAKPLVLIDGVEGDVNRVNPNDVASISVLKMRRLLLFMVRGLLMELSWLQQRPEKKAKSLLIITDGIALVM